MCESWLNFRKKGGGVMLFDVFCVYGVGHVCEKWCVIGVVVFFGICSGVCPKKVGEVFGIIDVKNDV